MACLRLHSPDTAKVGRPIAASLSQRNTKIREGAKAIIIPRRHGKSHVCVVGDVVKTILINNFRPKDNATELHKFLLIYYSDFSEHEQSFRMLYKYSRTIINGKGQLKVLLQCLRNASTCDTNGKVSGTEFSNHETEALSLAIDGESTVIGHS